jgi:NAD(P)-dependent dehydrogenase (short-subunit alcohol dehydrogenase family)
MITIDLSEKTILITGALGAIAEYVVRKLASAGATLILVDIKSEETARETIRRWQIQDSPHIYFSADITDSGAINRLVQKSFDSFPNLDTVLGHAGGCRLHPFATTSEEEYERIFRFNYFAQTYLARAVLPQWTQRKMRGHIIFTSSYVARVPHTQLPAYASAKAALENFARCLALEYALAGIRVNTISPGNVAAGSSVKIFEENPAYREFVQRVSPMRKRNSAEAIADAFVYLCSPMASEINGHVLSVDFGIGIGYQL